MTTIEWQKREIDLSPYLGQVVNIAFRHHNCTAQAALKIDEVSIEGLISDFDVEIEPIRSQLIGNYPNPFNPETTILFSLENEGHVSIDIYNIRGQKVKGLVNENLKSGNHQVIWNGVDDNGRPVSSGVYFYRMNTDAQTSTKRMVLMK